MSINPTRWSLSAQVVLALFVGILLGITGGSEIYFYNLDNGDLGQIGLLIIRLLKALAIPLILFSILDTFLQARIAVRSGMRLVAICLMNVSVAFGIGLILMNTLQPGLMWRGEIDQLLAKLVGTTQTAPGGTKLSLDPLQNLNGYIPQSLLDPLINNNVIAVVLMALLFGAALGSLKRHPPSDNDLDIAPLAAMIHALQQLLVRVLNWVVHLVPLAVLCLVAQAVGKAGLSIFSQLAGYVGIITLGLGLHGLIYYSLMAWTLSGRSPRQYLGNGSAAVLAGLSTNSSLAAVPITLQCLKQMGVADGPARLAACAGTNLNNDGVTLYEAMTALFLAQALGFDLDIGQQFVIVLAALMAGVGIAGIPEAGLIVLPLVLSAAGLPDAVVVAAIPLVTPVDWFIARIRSGVNVLSDLLVAILLDAWEKHSPAID
jgi:DAACS family dicarboxylate/amino acid:cation (Na+ or H+) symporter